MAEKPLSTIRNPLTIIGIFAGITEASGAAIFPFILPKIQEIYIWFQMIFPLILVLLFFITLNFNNKVLYAPSDFHNEDDFLKMFQNATPYEAENKLQEDFRNIEEGSVSNASITEGNLGIRQVVEINQENLRHDVVNKYVLAEDLVLRKISKEYGQSVKRDMRFLSPIKDILFDGVVMTADRVTAIEVTYLPRPRINPAIKNKLISIINAVSRLASNNRLFLIFVFVIEAPIPTQDILKELNGIIDSAPFQIKVRIFNFEDLKSEFYKSLNPQDVNEEKS